MRLLRQVGAGMKKVAAGMRRGLDVAERTISAADKASGGFLRGFASDFTGGQSDKIIDAYRY